MKKHLVLTSLIALVATTGMATAEDMTISDIADSIIIERAAQPSYGEYSYIAPDGKTAYLEDPTGEGYEAPEYTVETGADEEEGIRLADGSSVALNKTMTALDYEVLVPGEEEGSWKALGQDLGLSTGHVVISAHNPIEDFELDFEDYKFTTGEGDEAKTYTLGINEEEELAWFDGEDWLTSETFDALDEDIKDALNTNKGNYETDKSIVDEFEVSYATGEEAEAGFAVLQSDNENITSMTKRQESFAKAQSDYAEADSAYTTYSSSLANAVDTKIDAVNGTIHGLVADKNAKKTSNGKDYHGNLAVGTTTEDHLLALDASIGDLRDLDGLYLDSSKNVAQNLQSLNDGIESVRADFMAGDELTLSKANAYTDDKVNKLEKDMSGGVAAATALSAVSVGNVERGEVSVGGGYGYFNGQSAMAFGGAVGLSDRWSVNAGAGIAQGDKTQFSIRAGTNYKFKLF